MNRRDFLSVSVVSGAVACLPLTLMAGENDKPLTAELLRQLTLDTFPEVHERKDCSSIEEWEELFNTGGYEFYGMTYRDARLAFNKFHDSVLKKDRDIAAGNISADGVIGYSTNGKFFYWYIGLARNVSYELSREKFKARYPKDHLSNTDPAEYSKIIRPAPGTFTGHSVMVTRRNVGPSQVMMTINKRS